jgi:hypothetical protein
MRRIEHRYTSARPNSYPDPGRTRASSQPTRGLSLPNKHDLHHSLGGWKPSLPNEIKHGWNSPRATDNIYSSTGTCPITISNGNLDRDTHMHRNNSSVRQTSPSKIHVLYERIYDTGTQAVNTSASTQDRGVCIPL